MNQLQAIAHRIMIQRGLLPDFSPAAMSEARAMLDAPPSFGPGIRDLRARLWASIDNDSSRDLDQLSVAEAMPDGAIRIFVAVADVDALVKRGSQLDDHARTNTTSVYTAAAIFPMLPERLSTDLTSLGEERERLALVVAMVARADGTLHEADVYRAVVRNHAKLAYGSVAAWLDGSAKAPARLRAIPGLDAQLRMQDQVAQALRKLRFEHGALSLETPEAQAVFDGDELADSRPEQPNRAKELIEDLMVAANGTIARYLARHWFPSLRRVLRSPQRWERIVTLAQALGCKLPPTPDGRRSHSFSRRVARRTRADFPISRSRSSSCWDAANMCSSSRARKRRDILGWP